MQRHVDGLGRIVLPKELRDELHINLYDDLEIVKRGNELVLSKLDDSCIFCGSTEGLIKHGAYAICEKCRNAILAKDAKGTQKIKIS